jgi:hypothetical protein
MFCPSTTLTTLFLASRLMTLSSSAMVQYENSYRLYYIRGPAGVLVGVAEELS